MELPFVVLSLLNMIDYEDLNLQENIYIGL